MSRKKRLGDRKDGRRLRSLDAYNGLMPFIMETRNSSNNCFRDTIEITEVDRYFRKLRTSGYPGIGMLHLFIATFTRVVSQYPGLNRFISGQRIYARSNVEYIMTVKKAMSVSSGETSIKVAFDPSATIFDVYRRVNEEVEKVKNGEDTDTDDAANMMMKMPRFMLRFAMTILKWLDYHGRLPKSLVKASPFHGTMLMVDLGSIGLPTLFHHPYDFGNVSLLLTIGTKRKVNEMRPDGSVTQRKYLDFTLVLDERICDGFYFAQGYRLFKSILQSPEVLETPPEKVIEDVD